LPVQWRFSHPVKPVGSPGKLFISMAVRNSERSSTSALADRRESQHPAGIQPNTDLNIS
jgi:hypothetical protein